MPRVMIGMGSNMEPEKNLEAAAVLLRQHWPDIRYSSAYHSAPVGKTDQPDFLNAVAMIDTVEPPDWIMQKLQQVEHALHKNVTVRFGPRTIDLDLLLYGDDIVQTGTATVPHPRMHERRFVLEPLLELLPLGGRHPKLGRTWDELRGNVDDQECEKVPGVML